MDSNARIKGDSDFGDILMLVTSAKNLVPDGLNLLLGYDVVSK